MDLGVSLCALRVLVCLICAHACMRLSLVRTRAICVVLYPCAHSLARAVVFTNTVHPHRAYTHLLRTQETRVLHDGRGAELARPQHHQREHHVRRRALPPHTGMPVCARACVCVCVCSRGCYSQCGFFRLWRCDFPAESVGRRDTISAHHAWACVRARVRSFCRCGSDNMGGHMKMG